MSINKRARAKKATSNEEANKLLETLNFVKAAQSKVGTPYQTHCLLTNGYLSAFDGKITIGTPVSTAIECCPHTFDLIKSLGNCSADMSVTYDNLVLTIKSGKFKSIVDCVPQEIVVFNAPDPIALTVNNDVKNALRGACSIVLNANATRVVTKSVLFKNNVITGTDSFALVEFWHGFNGIPFDLLIPKETAELVAACDRDLIGIGGTSDSVTFHFSDGSYIKSNLYVGNYPNYESVLTFEGHPLPPPEDFFEAVAKIESFTENNYVYFLNGKVSSHFSQHKGTSFELDCIPDNIKYNATYIKTLKPYMQSICFKDNKLYFFGNNCRGCVIGAEIMEGEQNE